MQLMGATIGSKHTSDWGLGITDVQLDLPDPKVAVVDVPFCDGELDLTGYITGNDIKYARRKISLTLAAYTSWRNWHALISDLAGYLHGREMRIVLDTDPGYYYWGRLSVAPKKSDPVTGELTLTGEVDPYKYERWSSLEPWLWDPLDFEHAIIREYAGLAVNGELVLRIPGRRKAVVPIFECSVPLSLQYGSQLYNLPVGKSRVTSLTLGRGEHILTFRGRGTVSVDYRGADL